MQQTTDFLFIQSSKPNLNLKEQIQTMFMFQNNLASFFQQRNQELEHKSQKIRQNTLLAHSETSKIKEILNEFANQCRNQWVMVWQQFFSIFQRIVDLYQIKIEKLEAKLLEKDMKIETLQFEEKSLREMFNFYELPLFQAQCKEIEKSLNKKDEFKLINDKSHRRVKISDIIAEYIQNNSALSMKNNLNQFGEALTQQKQQSDNIQSQAPIALMQIPEHLNRQSVISNQSFLRQNHKLGENCFEMSAILSANSSQGVSPQKQLKFKKYSTKSNKENILAYSKRLKQNEQGKKRTNYFNKNGKNYESQVLGSACKLDQLRKNLLQRKKSEHLL